MAGYEVKKNSIYADMSKATKEDIKAIKNYRELGYKFVDITNKEKKKKVERINPQWVLENYKNLEEEFIAKKNEEAKDENGNVKYHIKKDGTKGAAYTLGAIGALQWFKSTYPEDVKEIKVLVDNAIKKAHEGKEKDKVKDLETSYKVYKEKCKKDKKECQSIEEYIRCYYWNKVFEIK